MKSSSRIQAAIEVMERIVVNHQPAGAALADWGKTHRFAGAGDRSAIGNLVYDALRQRALAAHAMQAETPRAIILGSLLVARDLAPSEIAALCDGDRHAPPPLVPAEISALAGARERPMADWQAANVPEWLAPHLAAAFGDRLADEGRALAQRAPVDIRANGLKASRDDVLGALARFGPAPSELSAVGIRIPAPSGEGRTPQVETEAAHGRGWFEVQDVGSQVAALLAGARPGDQVLDLCAGAGGKALAMAAAMRNAGRIVAYDSDRSRLRPIFERLTRAGATCVDVLTAGDSTALAALGASFDVVLVDAPCSGSGTWRRKPDAKWRLKPAVLAARQSDQRKVLVQAAAHVRPGGRLVYVTCSLLAEENGQQVRAFLSDHQNFAVRPWRQEWTTYVGTPPPGRSADGSEQMLLLTPAQHATDGFFVTVLVHTR